jgi:hypothetical protein
MAASLKAGDDGVLQADEIENIIVDAGIPMFDVGGVLFTIDDFLAQGLEKAPDWAQKGIEIVRNMLAPLCKKFTDFAWSILLLDFKEKNPEVHVIREEKKRVARLGQDSH